MQVDAFTDPPLAGNPCAVLFDTDEMGAQDEAGPGAVRVTTLEELGLEVGQTFLYLFDYGDEWRFKVRVHAINPAAPEVEYPHIVESVGKAPEQYPDWEEWRHAWLLTAQTTLDLLDQER